VTTTAALASVTWTLGEPTARGDTYQPGTPATITWQSNTAVIGGTTLDATPITNSTSANTAKCSPHGGEGR